METVTVSPKFQIVIPLHVRRQLSWEPGMKLHAFPHNGRLEFIPVKNPKTMRGFLKGIDTSIDRDSDRL